MRSPYPRLIIGLMCAVVGVYSLAAPEDGFLARKALTGVVKDALGKGIDGALVVLTPLSGPEAVRSALTDMRGRYRFEDVPRGIYRMTAVKDSYASTIGRFRSWLESNIDMILAPSGPAAPAPSRSDWIMTAPARDILRETEFRAVLSGRDGMSSRTDTPALQPVEPGELARGPMRSLGFLNSLFGEFETSFGETRPESGPAGSITGGQGVFARLAMGSPVGSRAEWDVVGVRARQSVAMEGAGIEARDTSAERLRAGFRYDGGDVGRLNIGAFYDHDGIAFDRTPGLSGAGQEPDRDRRAWGYNADWQGSVAPGAEMQVDLRYAGSVLGPGRGHTARRFDGVDPGDTGAAAESSAIGTSARVSKNVGSDHRVDVGVKARFYSLGEVGGRMLTPSAGQDPALLMPFGRDGWAVNVTAAEAWRFSQPLTLSAGLNVARLSSSTGGALDAVVPQAGLTFTPDPATEIRGLVSWVAAKRATLYDRTAVATAAGDPLGYRIRIERRFGSTVTLAIDGQSRPVFYEFIGDQRAVGAPVDDSRALYTSDAAARLSEAGLTLESRAGGGITLIVGTVAGRVEGRMAARVPDGDMLQALTDGVLRYVRTNVAARLDGSGTELQADLARVVENGADRAAPGFYEDSRLEVRILQNLGFLRLGATRWLATLAYTTITPQVDDEGTGQSGTDPRLWTTISQIRGGLSVRF
jgi:hypothetical protein